MKTFVVGDIHGCYDLLEEALERIIQYDLQGTVIFLGDYIDRGPNSRPVIERLMGGPPSGFQWLFIQGNHEDMCVYSHPGGKLRKGFAFDWLMNGGSATLRSYYPDKKIPFNHLEWMKNLPFYIEDKYRVYVHGGVDSTLPLEQQTHTMQWMRHPDTYNFDYRGKHIVHGHTPRDGKPLLLTNRTNLDTGAFYTGVLTVGVFDDEKAGGPIDIIQVSY